MFSREDITKSKKRERWPESRRESRLSIELKKSGQELHTDKVVGPTENAKMIVVDDGSECCETEGRKTDKKDQGGIERSEEKPGRIEKVINVEDGPTFCEKIWKQTAMNDPDNT